MLRFLAILISAAAIIMMLAGQSMAEAAPARTGDTASGVTTYASDHEAHDDGCEHCPECPNSHKRCPLSSCCAAACSTTLAPLAGSLPALAFERSSAGMRAKDDDPGSVTFGLDPPVPRRST
ncbi:MULTISPECIES: hypothetical protein [Xanthobacteraceae]|uniref:hypothetical protein n=1 Tax=Xanthobacteraceae TaxID=335928 RepID=UPI001E590482|nr:hypothetical protein [Xanthobacter autotrophicus]UDQ88543.1 hypothetical protein LJE71_20240 [Xanthobacter autotrophicus]